MHVAQSRKVTEMAHGVVTGSHAASIAVFDNPYNTTSLTAQLQQDLKCFTLVSLQQLAVSINTMYTGVKK